MIKNTIKKRFTISILSLLILAIIYLIPKPTTIDSKTIINDSINKIYLLNNDNLLIQTSLISKEEDPTAKAQEIINDLTINSKTKNYLNNNLKQIIPENTKLLDIKKEADLLKLNFSEEFLTTTPELEEKMVESIIYSLTELEGINKIMIFVNGDLLLKMPNSSEPLPNVLTRNYGINKIYDITTISSTNKITLYYYINIDNNYEAVPVTLFTNDDNAKIEIIIKNLKSSLAYQTDLVSFLNNNTKLLDYEITENAIKLNFSTTLLNSFYDDSILEEVKYAINSSIKDSLNISDITYYINGTPI